MDVDVVTTNPGLDLHACEQARLSRDPRFDGLFFTAVTSTGIYCRPVCPAPAPRPRNVRYYASAAAAEAAGFRPCLRCRPELSPEDGTWRRGDALVARALKLIEQGALDDQPVAALAQQLHLGERQLRRLFVERLGAPPIGVRGTRRLLFAKQLLTETRLPVTEVALAAGFNSQRRFNDAFVRAYALAPRDLRRQAAFGAGRDDSALVLRMAYRPPFDPGAMLAFLRGRALPGIEHVDGSVRIGAATTQAAVERSADVAATVPLLARATPLIGHFQIRNRGTIGGSLAHADPAAEYPAVALALDAEMEILSPGGRRTVPAADFFDGLDVAIELTDAELLLCQVSQQQTAKPSGFCLPWSVDGGHGVQGTGRPTEGVPG